MGPAKESSSRKGARLLAALLGAFCLSCSAPHAQSPNAMRPLEQRRAIEVIRRAIAEYGGRPISAHDVQLVSGKAIRIDVGISDQDIGVAYITADDAQNLGAAIKPPNKKDERLRVVRAGEEGK